MVWILPTGNPVRPAAPKTTTAQHATHDQKVSARVWTYPPCGGSGRVPRQALLAAAEAGVDIEVGEPSIGIDGDCHRVFSALEAIFTALYGREDVAFIATIRRSDP
jgi:hypothetical protein